MGRVLDLEVILALMAWFVAGEPKEDIPGVLRLPQTEYSFSETYTHRNAARAEVFMANTGKSTVSVNINFMGFEHRELAKNELEIHPLEFPYIYSGLDLVDLDGEDIKVKVSVEVENPEDAEETDVEVYFRQMDDGQELGESFQPFSVCRRLRGPSGSARWTEC